MVSTHHRIELAVPLPRDMVRMLARQCIEALAGTRAGQLCADINGFSVHASVRCDPEDRKGLEQLCRTVTRPALANERVQCNAAGQVVLKLKTPWRDGTTHQGTPPLEFMQRLAALASRVSLTGWEDGLCARWLGVVDLPVGSPLSDA